MKGFLKRILLRLKTFIKQLFLLIKPYLKQSLLLFVYHPAAYLVGMLIAGIIGVILGFFIKVDMLTAFKFYDPLLLTISPLFIFFGLIYRDGYYSDLFSLKFVALSALPSFIAQHVSILYGYYGAMTIGSCQIVTSTILPHQNGNTALELHLVLLGLQLLLQLPIFILAYYCGYRRSIKDDAVNE